MRFPLLLCFVILNCFVSHALAGRENWVHWRGPTFDGIAGKNAKPPIRWDTKTNIEWTVNLPGEGSSTPIILGDRVFVTSAEKTDRKSQDQIPHDERAKTTPDGFVYRFLITCLDRDTGKTIWQKTATEQVPHEGKHETNTYAAGSPTTDGERLYVCFGSRGLFCFSLSGDLIWQMSLGTMRTRNGWGEAITPVLADGLLIVNCDQEENSYVIAVDKLTGQTRWKVERPGEVTSWNTPFITRFEDKTQAIVNGTGTVKSYDISTGKILWECAGQTTNAIPSPIRFQDAAICMSGYRGAFATAIPLNSHGNVTNSPSLLWKATQGTPYVPSPLISGNRLFFNAGNQGVISCLDANTGKLLVDRRRLADLRSLYASPVLANGHIYYTSREGTTVVLKDNENLDIEAVNVLDDAIDASPVAVDDQLFLRSWNKLYCLRNRLAPTQELSQSTKRKESSSIVMKQVDLEQTPETSANASLADLDGDSDLDVVLAKGRHWPVNNRIMLNDGLGGFSPQNSFDLDSHPDRTYSASTGDLDGDGDVDIVVSNDNPDSKNVYLNNGKAEFLKTSSWGDPTWNTRNACLADVNGDGRLDLIVANRKSKSYVILNDGTGGFPKDSWIPLDSESATTIIPGDFNGDGRIDLAVPNRDGGMGQIHFHDGKRGFQVKASFGPTRSFSRTGASGDLNGDGFLDLAIGDEKEGTLICWNDGKGRFPEMIRIDKSSLVPYSIVMGDLNQDTYVDLVVGYATGGCTAFLNKGAGNEYEAVPFGTTKGAVYGIALGDVNGDGRTDVVASRSDATNCVFWNIKP